MTARGPALKFIHYPVGDPVHCACGWRAAHSDPTMTYKHMQAWMPQFHWRGVQRYREGLRLRGYYRLNEHVLRLESDPLLAGVLQLRCQCGWQTRKKPTVKTAKKDPVPEFARLGWQHVTDSIAKRCGLVQGE